MLLGRLAPPTISSIGVLHRACQHRGASAQQPAFSVFRSVTHVKSGCCAAHGGRSPSTAACRIGGGGGSGSLGLQSACIRVSERNVRVQAAADSQTVSDMEADSAETPAAETARKPAWVETPIILGSQSSSRKGVMDQLAKELGFTYSTVSADIDEKAIRLDDPSELVLALAEAKADAILRRWIENDALPDEGLFITCDQVVIGQGQILEKPESEEEARQMISGYSEASAVTIGSVRVLNLASGQVAQATDSCQVDFNAISDDVIDKLIAEGSVYHCAGGLMVEHPLVSPLIKEMHGEMESIMGLPKKLLLDLLRKANLTLREVNPEKPPVAF